MKIGHGLLYSMPGRHGIWNELVQEDRKLMGFARAVTAESDETCDLTPSFEESAHLDHADLSISFDDPLSLLGIGSFGAVHRANFQGAPAAVTLFDLSDVRAKDVPVAIAEISKEVSALCKLRHEHLLDVFGLIVDTAGRGPGMVTEICDGSLRTLLKEQGPPADAQRLAMEIASGMSYLHEQRIPHRGLKSSRVLLKGGTVKIACTGMAKLGDRGETTVMSESFSAKRSSRSDAAGTTRCYAPELLEDAIIDHFSCDVYSYAIILFELLWAKVPWEGRTILQIMRKVMVENKRPDSECEPSPDCLLSTLMRESWKADPSQRPTFHQILTRLQEG